MANSNDPQGANSPCGDANLTDTGYEIGQDNVEGAGILVLHIADPITRLRIVDGHVRECRN